MALGNVAYHLNQFLFYTINIYTQLVFTTVYLKQLHSIQVNPTHNYNIIITLVNHYIHTYIFTSRNIHKK